MELNLWRREVEKLLAFLESECGDESIRQLAELIYFLGESECDGVGSYIERRNPTIIESLLQSADLIASVELRAILVTLQEEIQCLPEAGNFGDIVAAAIEAAEKGPVRS